MNIETIFEKNIHRPISGVVKVQDIDQDKAWTVLDEYVVTPEIERLLSNFFSAYNGSIDKATDDIGVWISGFFGSGKSHFLEIINHIIANAPIASSDGKKQKTPLEFFKEKKIESFLLADATRASSLKTETIIFNIDAKAEQKDGDYAILNVFVRVFNGLQGFYEKNQWVAALERKLTEENVFDKFQEAFKKSSGKSWIENRDAVLLNRTHVIKAITEVLPKLNTEDASAWFDELKSKHAVSPEDFAKQVKAYLGSKGNNSRIVFLVDEVGQFIGDNTSKMLQLQTITEQLGIACKGKAWVIVTSQEDVDKAIGFVNQARTNDFSKIQGRFKTRLSLSSANVDEVIKYRILEKQEASKKLLLAEYGKNEAILKNLLAFTGEGVAMPFYKNGEDFTATYPFVPYQFHLLQQVYATIRRTGATGQHIAHGERSMINAFQNAARQYGEAKLGTLIPFYSFYESIENSLEGFIKATIARASNDKALGTQFDASVLKLLFLLRNLEKDIPPNVDNIATLCVDSVDCDKLKLKKDVEASLLRLEKQNYIRRNDDLYFFLSDEEQEVEREIQHTEVDSARAAKRLFHLIFDELIECKNSFNYKPLKRTYNINRVCDNHSADRQTEELSFVVVSPLYDAYSDFAANPAQVSAMKAETALLILDQDKAFDTEFNIWIKTEKFTEGPHPSQSVGREKIIQEYRNINISRRERLKKLLEPLILSSKVYIAGKPWHGSMIKKPKDVYEQALNYLVQNTYNKLSLIRASTEDFEKDLHLILSESDTSSAFIDNMPHKEASETIKTYILLQGGKAPFLADIVERFEKKPHGWLAYDIVLIIARLAMRGDVEIRADAPLIGRDAIPYLQKKPQWRQVRVAPKQKVSSEILKSVQQIAKDWFGVTPGTDSNLLFDLVRLELQKLYKELSDEEGSARYQGYPGLRVILEGKALIDSLLFLREQNHLFSAMAERKDEINSFKEAYQDIKDFYRYQINSWKELLNAKARADSNLDYLQRIPEAASTIEEINTILGADSPYSKLKDSSTLSKRLLKIEEQLFLDYKAEAGKQIETAKGLILQVLKEEDINSASEHSKYLKPIEELSSQIVSSKRISEIELAGMRANPVASEQAKLIRRASAARNNSSNATDNALLDAAASKQTLKITDFHPFGKPISSTQDADEFTSKLKAALLDGLKNGPIYLE